MFKYLIYILANIYIYKYVKQYQIYINIIILIVLKHLMMLFSFKQCASFYNSIYLYCLQNHH